MILNVIILVFILCAFVADLSSLHIVRNSKRQWRPGELLELLIERFFAAIIAFDLATALVIGAGIPLVLYFMLFVIPRAIVKFLDRLFGPPKQYLMCFGDRMALVEADEAYMAKLRIAAERERLQTGE